MAGQLYCGAGKANITPPEAYLTNLQALGPQRFSGILDPLFVRVIMLKNGDEAALIVSLDLDKAPNHDEFSKALSELTGVPEQSILYFGIHTHTAPIMGYRPFEPHGDVTKKPKACQDAFYQYTDLIKAGLLKAAGEAKASLQPARIGWGHGASYINVNRCCQYDTVDENGNQKKLVETGYNGAGPVSRDVFLLRAENLKGEPIAFFVNYAMHNVVMFLHDSGDGGIFVSHDVGGCVSMNLEKRYPEAVAIWSSGAAGNINPIMATQNYFPQVSSGEADLSPVKDFKMSVEMRDRLAGRHVADIIEANKKIVCTVDHARIQSVIKWIDLPEAANQKNPPRIRLRLISIGEIALVGVNGELFSTLGEIIQQNAPIKDTVIINHDCSLMLDNPGYILDDETNALCDQADIVRMPHNGFKAYPGYLPAQLAQKTKEMFHDLDK